MPAKSLLTIDVDDSAFKQFNALFQNYQTALKSTPTQWRNIAAAQQQGVKGFRNLVGAQAAVVAQQTMLGQQHKDVLLLLKGQESVWDRIKKTSDGSAKIIKGMTEDILKWMTPLSLLAGVGGLAGLAALGSNVAGGRRSALGLGATYGGQRAFDVAFGRFVDPSSVLSGVAGARGDVSKRVAFSGLGMLNDRDLEGDNAAVSARVLERAKRVADKTPDQLLGTMFQTYQLGTLGLTEEDFRRLKRTPATELAQQQGQFRKLSSDYAVSNPDQRAYQELVTTLKDASNQIDTVFVRGLAPLVRDGSIDQLSKSVVGLVKAFSESDVLKGQIHDLTDAMAGLSKFIKDPLGSIKEGADKDVAAAKAAGKVDPVSSFTSWILSGRVGSDAKAFAAATYSQNLPVKPGAGAIDPGLGSFATRLTARVPGIDRFTAFNDDYHKRTNSAHADGRAFDFTIKNPAKSAEVADLVRTEMMKAGIRGTVIDEYTNPSSRATAGHIHVQTDVRISNATGNNIVVQTQQATPSP